MPVTSRTVARSRRPGRPSNPGSSRPAGPCETSDATTLRRGLAVLELLARRTAGESGGFGVTRIARELGLDKSTASRTLKVLLDEGFVDRDAQSRAYRLSWKVYVMGIRSSSSELIRAGVQVLPHLSERFGETTHISVLRDSEILVVHAESVAGRPRKFGFVGQTVSAWTTATGRTLLLDESRETLLRVFGNGGPQSVRTVDATWRAIQSARRDGYVKAENEVELGISSAAAPIRDSRGLIVAAIGCAGPGASMDGRLDQIGQVLREAATAITRRLE